MWRDEEGWEMGLTLRRAWMVSGVMVMSGGVCGTAVGAVPGWHVQRITPPVPNGTVSGFIWPRVAVSPGGAAVATWTVLNHRGGVQTSYSMWYSSRVSATARFGAAHRLGRDIPFSRRHPGLVPLPVVAHAGRGRFVIVAGDATRNALTYRFGTRGGRVWGPVRTILGTVGEPTSGDVELLASEDGTVTAHWHSPRGLRLFQRVATMAPSSGRFGAAVTLGRTSPASPNGPEMAVVGGRAAVAWLTPGEESLQVAVRASARSAWVKSKLTPAEHFTFDLASTADGRFIASWQPVMFRTLAVSTWQADAGWSPASVLADLTGPEELIGSLTASGPTETVVLSCRALLPDDTRALALHREVAGGWSQTQTPNLPCGAAAITPSGRLAVAGALAGRMRLRVVSMDGAAGAHMTVPNADERVPPLAVPLAAGTAFVWSSDPGGKVWVAGTDGSVFRTQVLGTANGGEITASSANGHAVVVWEVRGARGHAFAIHAASAP